MPDAPRFPCGADYLQKGYFLDPTRRQLDPAVVDGAAHRVAIALKNANTKYHQLRRFFNQMRAIDRSIGTHRSYEEARADIAALKSSAAYQVGRGLVWSEFKCFIDRNVDLSVQNLENFRSGCIPHFQAVLGFFVYETRGKQ